MTLAPSRNVTDVPAGDELVDDVVLTKELLRDEARVRLGVTGQRNTEGMRTLLRRHGLTVYPLMALGFLHIADMFQSYAFAVLAPDIARSLGIGFGLTTGVAALRGLATAAAPLPMAWLSQHRSRRAMLCIVTGMGWSVLTLYTGLVTSLLGLILILVADGLTTGSVSALHGPLLMDSYHPDTRVRVFSGYTAIVRCGEIFSPLLVAILAGVFDFTWRGVFIALGVVSTATTLFALRLKDPGFGKWDTQQLRESVHELHGEHDADLPAEAVALGFWEICRRLLLISTIRRLLAGFAVFGVLAAPLGIFITFFLESKWDLDAGERGVFFGYQAAISVITLVLYGARGEKQFRQDPGTILRTTGGALAAAIVFIAIGGLAPNFWVMIASFGASAGCIGVLGPALGVAMMSIIPATMRPHSAALGGIFSAVGSLAGALLLSSVQAEYGDAGSIVTIAFFGILGSIVIASAGKFIKADLDRMIDEILEDEELKRITHNGGRLPMLACRGIDFSYGQMQVLYDVDFTVDDGEMVALLGVNGAGKSTLLKVISGIGLPSRGSVRYRGHDITYLDAERRVGLGITQIPGGKAVFGPLTVVENMRAFGYTVSTDRKRLDVAIEQSFEAFPRLAERRNSLAAQLSGGEQQMLALSKALILEPRLLVIDELSLGLAPVIVGQLLDMVRRINATGTAVVLVEQSVNIALNLVEHAYFMEKGEMKFDGRAADLLVRDDLLRAVFLAGTAATDLGR
jgi:ABC-type branched-subunit amino acid transport system ATPase component